MAQDMNILLVEDNDLDVEILQRGLKKTGSSGALMRARDGLEALEILKENAASLVPRPYVILLDINMPRMNGFEFLEEVRKDQRLHRIVVFVLSTSDTPDDIATAYDQNIAGYIVKDDLGESFVRALDMIESFCRIVELPQ